VASLNRTAFEIASNFDVHACTDITGFGMAGHTIEMAKASGVQINLFFHALPVYPHAMEMYRKGETTGSNLPNRKISEGSLRKKQTLTREEEELLFDPQTSGGLLLAVPSSQADPLQKALIREGLSGSSRVGEVEAASQAIVTVL